MKYLILLMLVHASVQSYSSDSYAQVYHLSRQSFPGPGNSTGQLQGSITSSQSGDPVKAIITLFKQLFVGILATEVVNQTGGSLGEPAVAEGVGQDDSFGHYGFSAKKSYEIDIDPTPYSFKFVTEWQDTTGDSPFSQESYVKGLKYFFGVPYPSNEAIDTVIKRIAEEAILGERYLHLPTVRSILEEGLHSCSAAEKMKFINTFFKSETGLITEFAVSRFGEKITVPFTIYDSVNKDLLTKLHDIAYHLEYCDGTYLVEACRAVEYLKGALRGSDQAYRRSCRILFDAYYQLVMGHGCTALVELADLTEGRCRSFKKELQRQVVHTVAQFCEETTDLQNVPAEDRAMINRQAHGLVNNVNNLVAELKTVDLVLTKRKKRRLERMYREDIQGYVDRALPRVNNIQQKHQTELTQEVHKAQPNTSSTPARAPPQEDLTTTSEDQAMHESEDQQEKHSATEINQFITGRTAAYHTARQEALTAYTNGTAVAEPLSDAAHKLLVQHDCSTELFSVGLDTPVQQALQHEFVSIVNATAALDILNHDELALVLVPTLTQLAEAGVGFTVHNKLKKAATIADCCWTALDCLGAATEGAVEGGVNTARSLFTLIRHPVQSVTNIAQNLVHCGYQLGKVLHEVGDIAISSVVDPEQGQRKRTLFYNKLQVLHEAIQHKIQTTPVRELIKDATAAATEIWLTGKCLRATAPLINKALEKAEKAAQYIEEAIEMDNNFHIGDGVVTVAATTAETVEAATAAQGTARLGQVLERGGQLYAMAEQLQRDPQQGQQKKNTKGPDKDLIEDGDKHPSTPVGRKGDKFHVLDGTNKPAVINGRRYCGHALDRMQQREILPRMVEDAIENGKVTAVRNGRRMYYNMDTEVRVILESDGTVVTTNFMNYEKYLKMFSI